MAFQRSSSDISLPSYRSNANDSGSADISTVAPPAYTAQLASPTTSQGVSASDVYNKNAITEPERVLVASHAQQASVMRNSTVQPTLEEQYGNSNPERLEAGLNASLQTNRSGVSKDQTAFKKWKTRALTILQTKLHQLKVLMKRVAAAATIIHLAVAFLCLIILSVGLVIAFCKGGTEDEDVPLENLINTQILTQPALSYPFWLRFNNR